MRKIYTLLLSFLFVGLTYGQADTVSVIANGHFDTDVSEWTLELAGTAAATIEKVDVDGRTTLKLNVTDAGANDTDIILQSTLFPTPVNYVTKQDPVTGEFLGWATPLSYQIKGDGISISNTKYSGIVFDADYKTAKRNIEDGTWTTQTMAKNSLAGGSSVDAIRELPIAVRFNLGGLGTGAIYIDSVLLRVTNAVDATPVLSDVTTGTITAGDDVVATSDTNATIYLVDEATAAVAADIVAAQVAKDTAYPLTPVTLITTNIEAGNYIVYAVDAYGVVSDPSAVITIEAGAGEDQTPPVLSNVTTGEVVIGNEIFATSNENGIIYLVEESLEVTYANLNVFAQASTTVTADTEISFATTSIEAGNYVVYATDEAENISDPSEVINLVAPSYTVTFTVKNKNEEFVADATVAFNNQTVTTDANGVAVFTEVAAGSDLAYTVTGSELYMVYEGVVSVVDQNVDVPVTLLFVGINDNNNEGLTVYPNPANSVMYINGSNASTYTILNITGKVITQNILDNGNAIDVSNLHAGVYFVRCIQQNGKVLTVKFIKE